MKDSRRPHLPGTPATNTGIANFEDIRLYLNKRCFPGSYPVGDFEPDCDVDFYDFAILAQSWLTIEGQPNYNPVCDISVPHNGIIDENDLARFCDYWLWQEVGREGWTSMSLGLGEDLYASPPPSGELAESTEQSQSDSKPESQPEEEPQPLVRRRAPAHKCLAVVQVVDVTPVARK